MKACTLTGPTLRLDPCLFLASLWPHSAFFIFHSIIPQIVLFSVIGSVALCCACAFSLREVEGSIPIVEWTRPRRERSPASRVSCRVLPLPPQARTLTGTYIRQSSHRAQTHSFGGEGRAQRQCFVPDAGGPNVILDTALYTLIGESVPPRRP